MTVSRYIQDRVSFKFSPEFESQVRYRAMTRLILRRHERLVDEFFDGMRFRTYMGEMRYERDTQNRWQYPGEPFIGTMGYAFCSWPLSVYRRGLRRKIHAFMVGGSDVQAGNREFLMDVGNYAAFLYILGDHRQVDASEMTTSLRFWDMPPLRLRYEREHRKSLLVKIGVCALVEFCDPRHPTSHYHVHDQTLKTGTGAVGRTPVF